MFQDHFPLILSLLAMLPLLLASGLFSGTETALFSLTRHQRRQFSRRRTLVEAAVDHLLDDARSTLITLLLGNMTVNVLYFVLSTMVLLQLEQEPYALSPASLGALSLVPLVVLILLGEVLPKLFAAHLAMAWSSALALPLLLLHRGISPVRLFIDRVVVTPLARLVAPPRRARELSQDELEALLRLNQHRGVIDPGEEEILRQVLILGQLKVRDLMTPRVDVQAFDLRQGPEALVELFKVQRLRRIPVYEGDLDQVRGVIYARQMMLNPPTTAVQLGRLIRSVLFVPEQQRADQLLVQMRKLGATLAIVVDEYGGTAGLVTLEDVVEQLVGEVVRENEPLEEPEVVRLEDGSWRVGGSLPIHEWAQSFGPIAQPAGISTLAGLVMTSLGRVPQPGDHTRLGNVLLEVEAVEGGRVRSLRVRLLEHQAEARREGTA